ncbi:MAG: gliding motility-associated C-terminal domain-containing protein [Bacteroidota bacterium]
MLITLLVFGFLHFFTPVAVSDECGLLPDADGTLILQTLCGEEAVLCTNIELGQEWRYRFKQNERLIEPNLGCNFDTLGFYSPINEEVLSSNFAPFYIKDWQVNSSFFSGEFLSVNALVDSLNTWDSNGDWQFDQINDRITGGNPRNRYGALTIEILPTNTTIVSEYNINITARNVGIVLTEGEHTIAITDLANRCTEELKVRVVCTTTDVVRVNVEQGESRKVCFNNDELLGEIATLSNTDINPRNYTWRELEDNCVEFRGNLSGQDSTHIVVCDEIGVCDSTLIIISVQSGMNTQQRALVRLGEKGTFCINQERFGLPGALQRFENTCASSTSNAQFELDQDNFCINYEGVELGNMKACIEMCDVFGNCDDFELSLTVVQPQFVSDTIFLDVETEEYCFDISQLEGNINIVEDCETPSPMSRVVFELDPKNYCIQYTGTSVGKDSLCVWLSDNDGNATLTVLYINVVQAEAAVVSESVFINETIRVCVDTTELPGRINQFFNTCPEESGVLSDIFIANNHCVEITGLELGQESACLVLCDDLGVCDTTYLTINVVPFGEPPNVQDDSISTSQMKNVNIRVQDNDNLIGGVSVISIGTPPKYGQVVINADGTITYFPDEKACTGEDRFTYLLCNDAGCGTAIVSIKVFCEQMNIFTGMSPNGDGINDVFFISNIDLFPDNHLQVYNRWGHLVYEAEGYKNDWQGTWKGRLLPDGTYFYILTILDKETEIVRKGNIELHR